MLSLKLSYEEVVCISDFPMLCVKHIFFLLCFVDCASRYNHVKKTNLMHNLFLLYYPTRTTDNHLKRIISTNCCIHPVLPPDDGPGYARNM